MGLFGKVFKTVVDVATSPIDIVKDVVTLGGTITDEESAIAKKAKKLDYDLSAVLDEIEEL